MPRVRVSTRVRALAAIRVNTSALKRATRIGETTSRACPTNQADRWREKRKERRRRRATLLSFIDANFRLSLFLRLNTSSGRWPAICSPNERCRLPNECITDLSVLLSSFFSPFSFSPLFSIPLFFYFFLPLFLGFWFFEDWELGLLFKVKILGEQRGAERRQGGIESCARSRFAFLLLDVFVFEFVWRCVIPSVCLRSLDGPACVFGFCRGMRVWKKLSKILSDRFFSFFFFF